MSDKWIRLPEKDAETGGLKPDLLGYGNEIDGYVANRKYPGNAPFFLCRVYADDATLNSLAAESKAKDLSELPKQALNNMSGLSRSKEEWRKKMNVGKP